MRSKIPLGNRGYAAALDRIGTILRDVEAEKERKERPPEQRPKRKTTKELEKELEDDLRDIENPLNPAEEKKANGE
jgi:hypothetical protein